MCLISLVTVLCVFYIKCFVITTATFDAVCVFIASLVTVLCMFYNYCFVITMAKISVCLYNVADSFYACSVVIAL